MNKLYLGADWGGFFQNIRNFFETTIAGQMVTTLGYIALVVGFIMIVWGTIAHRANPQSRSFKASAGVIVMIVGALALIGLDRVILFFKQLIETLLGWIV